MRWTRQHRRRTVLRADGKVVWFWHLDAGAKSAWCSHHADDGDKKPDHRGEHEGNR
jgi:hypothetical protein